MAWTLCLNVLRLASGVLLLPLLLRLLPKADFGMYFVFLSLAGIVVVLDLGFSPTVGRFINYAMGGARKLSALGLADEKPGSTPNYKLLWELVATTRTFYRFVALGTFLLLSTGGTFMVYHKVAETSSPGMTWLAWGVAVIASVVESYLTVWNMILRNLDQVLPASRITTIAYGSRLLLAAGLLLGGGGLLSWPLACLVTSGLIGVMSRRHCLRFFAGQETPRHVDWRTHFATIWPNCWRLGLYFGGLYLSTNANVLLCSSRFGLEANAKYGLSVQVMNIVASMAGVWMAVKWPLVGQLVAQRNLAGLRQLLWPRFCLVLATFAVLAAFALLLGPSLIRAVRSDKELLEPQWLLLLALGGLLDVQCTLWNTVISLWNRLPMLWPSLVTNATGLGVNLLLVSSAGAQPGLLVVGPLLAGLVFNYWYWPNYGARLLGLNWIQFNRRRFSTAAN